MLAKISTHGLSALANQRISIDCVIDISTTSKPATRAACTARSISQKGTGCLVALKAANNLPYVMCRLWARCCRWGRAAFGNQKCNVRFPATNSERRRSLVCPLLTHDICNRFGCFEPYCGHSGQGRIVATHPADSTPAARSQTTPRG